MKRILIGVLFVVAIAAIGLGITSLVYGQFGTQEDVVQDVAVNLSPTVSTPFTLDMNGLESRTISNTHLIRSQGIESYSAFFTSCYYENKTFIDGTSLIHVDDKSVIMMVDDDFSPETVLKVTEDGKISSLLLKYKDGYLVVLLLGRGKFVPVEAGDYILQFSTFSLDDVDTNADLWTITKADISPENGDFVMMICSVR